MYVEIRSKTESTFILFTLFKGAGGRVQPKFLVKLGLEIQIGVYQKASPIGRTFGDVSESLRLLRSARRLRP